MSDRALEFVLDVVSPNAYLAWWPLRDLLARTGCELRLLPVFLGGMHKLTGNEPPLLRNANIRNKNAYDMLEMERFVADHGLTRYTMNPHFPMHTLAAQRMLVAASESGRDLELAELLLKASWENRLDVSDVSVLGEALTAGGFDADALQRATRDPAVKQRLIDNTEAAVERGAFGVPTFFLGDQMFFGKERLGQIERLLTA